jgi:hypothetical protein
MHDLAICEIIDKIPTMGRSELNHQWAHYFANPPNAKLRLELMRPVLAYRIQESVIQRPKPSVKRSSTAIRQNLIPQPFKTGTRIVREWNGHVHEVAVVDGGYEYRGEFFKSLSPIATKITGTKWSGPAFFGTKPKDRLK